MIYNIFMFIFLFYFIQVFSLAPQLQTNRLSYYNRIENSCRNRLFQNRRLSFKKENESLQKLLKQRWIGTGSSLISLRLDDQLNTNYEFSLIHASLARYLGERSNHWASFGIVSKETILEALKYVDLNIAGSMGSLLEIAVIEPDNRFFDEILDALLLEGADPHSPKIHIHPISQNEAEIFHGQYISNDSFSHNPLYRALSLYNFGASRKLLESGSDPNITLGNTQTPFQYFIQRLPTFSPESTKDIYVTLDLFDTFLRKGADLYVKNQNGTSAYLMILNLPEEIQTLLIPTLYQHLNNNRWGCWLQTLFPLQFLFNLPNLIDMTPPHEWLKRLHTPIEMHVPSFTSEYKDGRNLLLFLEGLDKIENLTELLEEMTAHIPLLELPYLEARIGHLLQYIQKRLEKEAPQLMPFRAQQIVIYYTEKNYSYNVLVDFLIVSLMKLKEIKPFALVLLKEMKSLPQDSLGPRNLTLLKCFKSDGNLNLNHLSKKTILSDLAVLPVLFLLEKEPAWVVYRQVISQKGLPIYNPEKPAERLILFTLMMRCGSALGEQKDRPYKMYLDHIRQLQEKMNQKTQTIHSFGQILPSDLDQAITDNKVDWNINGRSVSFQWKGKEYLFKLKKKGELFEDAAVIQHGLEHHLEPIERQFETPSMIHIKGHVFDKMLKRIKTVPSMINEEFDGQALFVVIKHSSYFHYLIDDNDHQNDFDNLQRFLESLKQNVKDFSYLAHRGCFLVDIGSYSHGEERTYNVAPFLEIPDYWNHPAGCIDDLKKHSTISNFGKLGVRDFGNLLRPSQNDKNFNPRVRALNQKVLSQTEKKRMEHNIFSKALIEHLWQATLDTYSFLEKNLAFLMDMTTQDFVNIVFDTVFTPFIDTHFSDDTRENIKKTIFPFIAPLIEADFDLFKKCPSMLYQAISRETARDHSLQNIYTAIAHTVTLVNVATFANNPSLSIQITTQTPMTHLKKQELNHLRQLRIAENKLKKSDYQLSICLPLLSKEQFIALFKDSIGTPLEQDIKQYLFDNSQCIPATQFKNLKQEYPDLIRHWRTFVNHYNKGPFVCQFEQRAYHLICSEMQCQYIRILIWYLELTPSISTLEVYSSFSHNWAFFAPIFYNYIQKFTVEKPDLFLFSMKEEHTFLDIINFVRPLSDQYLDQFVVFLKDSLNVRDLSYADINNILQTLSVYELSLFIDFLANNHEPINQFVHQGFLNSLPIRLIDDSDIIIQLLTLISRSDYDYTALIERVKLHLKFATQDTPLSHDVSMQLINAIHSKTINPHYIIDILMEFDIFLSLHYFNLDSFSPHSTIKALWYILYFPHLTENIHPLIDTELFLYGSDQDQINKFKMIEKVSESSQIKWSMCADIIDLLNHHSIQKTSIIYRFILSYGFVYHENISVVKNFLRFSDQRSKETHQPLFLLQLLRLSQETHHTFHKKIQTIFPDWEEALKGDPHLMSILHKIKESLISQKTMSPPQPWHIAPLSNTQSSASKRLCLEASNTLSSSFIEPLKGKTVLGKRKLGTLSVLIKHLKLEETQFCLFA